MKPSLPLTALALTALAFTSCQTIDTLRGPLDSSGPDPLASPLDGLKQRQEGEAAPLRSSSSSSATNSDFAANTKVEVSASSTGLFRSYPRFFAKPQQELPAGTVGTALETRGAYTYLTLQDGGAGYVKTVDLIEKYEVPASVLAPPPAAPRAAPSITAPSLPAPSQLSNQTATSNTDESEIGGGFGAIDAPAPAPEEKDYELSDEEILRRIEARKAAQSAPALPAAPSGSTDIAPEPEVQGLELD